VNPVSTRSGALRCLRVWLATFVPLTIGACSEDRRSSDPGEASPTAAEVLTGMQAAWPSWGSATPPLDLPQEGAIRAAELARHADDPAVVTGLTDDDPRVRARAAWAVGRIGGSRAAARLAASFDDPTRPLTPAWVAALAFLDPPKTVAGESLEPEGVWQTLVEGLWARYAVTEDAAMAEALLLAIARIGGQHSQRLLGAETTEPPIAGEERRRGAALEASAIACSRGYALGRAGLRAIAQGLVSESAPIRMASAYALGRCAGPSAEALAGPERGGLVERLAPMVVSAPEEARLAWRALAALGEVVAEIPADILGASPPPWLVELEAVSALAGHADGRRVLAERIGTTVLEDLDGPRVHVVVAALRGLRKAIEGTPELLAGIQSFEQRVAEHSSKLEGRRSKALALIGCELQFLKSLRSGELEPLARCAADIDGLPQTHGDTLVVDALLAMGGASTREEKMNEMLQRARDPRSAVAAPALTGLAELDDPRIGAVLREALQRPDPGVQAAAASAIAVRSVDAARRDDAVIPILLDAVHNLDNGRAIEARLAAIEALGHLARSNPMAKSPGGDISGAPPWLQDQLVPLAKDPAWAIRSTTREALLGHDALVGRFDALTPERFPEGFGQEVITQSPPSKGMRLRTDAGTISIAFEGAPAPVMQANLVRLAGERYFNGLTFHRVVPGFVVQGGDPRGDGYGGPGWLVPCEWSNLRVERGTVGIALAGKDTGGSQIFIAQAPQPHLDGRYTVIGQVVEGMDVVDRLLVHDRILEVEVLP
jgi:cyclophilin family peptidyl-prolyl cis-trans isomerase/HEAT repeat protein